MNAPKGWRSESGDSPESRGRGSGLGGVISVVHGVGRQRESEVSTEYEVASNIEADDSPGPFRAHSAAAPLFGESDMNSPPPRWRHSVA